ncbi:MAG: L,D-transpeptidase family protein [Polyangiaceae bacterium]|nr:L,D-transpeptidase family protein [Polyangiaceae bacterium]
MRLVGIAACSLAAVLHGCSAPPASNSPSEIPTPYANAYEGWAPMPPPPGYAGNFAGYPAPPSAGSLGSAPAFVFPDGASPGGPPMLPVVAVPEPQKPPEPIEFKPIDTRPRMGAIGQFAYIYKRPAKKGLALGYIRMGTAVPLLSDRPVRGDGCKRGWYAVAPRGYACLEKNKTTLDLNDPYFSALKEVAPKEGVWPYRYAFSNGAPMYSRVPTPAEQEKHEKKFGPRGSYVQLAEWSAGHEELLSTDPITATDPVPSFFAGGKRQVGGGPRDPRQLVWRVIPNGSMLAYAKAFQAEGRTWLLTPDLMLVPADRVRAIRPSEFQGVELGRGIELPLAWNRAHGPKPKYRRAEGGALVKINGAFGGKSYVPITGEEILHNGEEYWAVRGEPDTFVAASDVTIARARKEMPRGLEPNRKWIEVKILPGTLTAYEGLRPIFSTLFSPGKGGVPVPGHDHTKYATTATGYFPIEWKDRVATMSNEKSEPKVLWFSDVPNIQYLRPPLAMHVAYWHEDFGKPKSAECVNVSPKDGKWLFAWTEPALPEGWGGIRPGDGNGRSTPVLITAK